jgi:lipopolysaccharide/colanic/teichoic acid biosynthesis glycosyltransferase
MTNSSGRPSLSISSDAYAPTRPFAQPPNGLYVRFAKPVIDRVLGLVLLILFTPVILISALIVLISLGRPILYTQERVGLDGRHFKLYKLRTMSSDRRTDSKPFDGPDRRRTHKSPDDPRVSGLVRVLRATRLDETPQFWNVLKGDMSIVGPRPEMPGIVAQYEWWQHARHVVKPGVTGPWQVSRRNGKPMHLATEIDLDYISELDAFTDLRILLKTPLAMIGGRRGY